MHYDTQITAQVMKCKLQPWYIPKIVEMYYYTRERFFPLVNQSCVLGLKIPFRENGQHLDSHCNQGLSVFR